VSREQRNIMGAYIRQQRRIADLSMRQVSAMVGISNPYLSQIERGLRAPSEAVAAGIATALGVSVDELYDHDAETAASEDATERPAESGTEDPGVLESIENATELTLAQRTALAEIYRSFVRSNRNDESPEATPTHDHDE
jgi:transcriptional regulator with XRE-family HTH domain